MQAEPGHLCMSQTRSEGPTAANLWPCSQQRTSGSAYADEFAATVTIVPLPETAIEAQALERGDDVLDGQPPADADVEGALVHGLS